MQNFSFKYFITSLISNYYTPFMSWKILNEESQNHELHDQESKDKINNIKDQLKVNNNLENNDQDNLNNNFELEHEEHLKSLVIKAVIDYISSGNKKSINSDILFELYTIGINPITIYEIISNYVKTERFVISQSTNNFPSNIQLDKFVNDIYSTFKDSYLDNLKLKNIVNVN